jgi:hypothetical protein
MLKYMLKYKILGIFANHTTTPIKYNISLNNILLIKPFLTNIIIIDSKNENYAQQLYSDFKTDDKLKNYLFIDNDNYFDFGKWVYTLKNIDTSFYDYILLINDSIILTHDITKYFNYIENIMNITTNLYAYNDSTQIKYHYQSYCFLIKKNIIQKFIDFFESRKIKIFDLQSLTYNIELNMCEIDNDHDCFIKIGNEYNISKNLYWENEELYKYLLSKNIFAILKLKKIFDIRKNYKINIYGYNINDFDFDFYRETYDDINKLSNSELLDHFIQCGQYEGRRYNKLCYTILPPYYRDKLKLLGLLYFFDIPDDFDIYFYKKNNDDIKNLSNIEILYHYIDHGFYEGRIYKYNIDLNNFYLKFLNILNITEDFNIYSYILLNKNLNNYSYLNAIKHYIEAGINEKLLYKKEDLDKILCNFNYNNYIKIHNDNNKIKNLCILDAIKYFINSNDKNIYKIPNDFNYKIYKQNYRDLSNINNNELEIHYLKYGIHENRNYKILNLLHDFNPYIYKKIYKDLEKLNNDELIKHYITHGIKENRIYKLPSDFNPIIYKRINNDLNKLNNEQLKIHYLYTGVNEKRKYK